MTPMRRSLVLVALSVAFALPLANAKADGPAAPTSPQAQSEIALQRALSQPFNLVLEKVEIAEAFKQIAATAKISLNVDPACYDYLPYGATTRVSADFRNSKLRDAIEQVLITLGLQQTISGSAIIIRPSGPLLHIGRRAQLDELKLLQDLRTNELTPPAPPAGANADANAPFDWATAIRTSLDRQNIVISFEGDASDAAGALQSKALVEIRKQLPLSVFRSLEMFCQFTNQIWFAESDTASLTGGGAIIRIMPMKKWITRQLDRPIELSFTNAPLDQVVAELSHISGIRFVPEPGLYQTFPAVNVKSVNSSVAQTLEALSGVTRITYDVRDDSVYLHLAGSPSATPPSSAPAKIDAVIGSISLPGTPSGPALNVFIHESDLSPELNTLRKKKIEEAIATLQADWSTPKTPAQPLPSTQSATQPH